MLLVLNGKYIGATEFPLPSIQLNDGLMDIIIVKEAGFPLLKEILTAKITVNWDGNQTNIDHFQASSIALTTPTTRILDLDGECYEGKNHKINVIKEHQRVLVPGLEMLTV